MRRADPSHIVAPVLGAAMVALVIALQLACLPPGGTKELGEPCVRTSECVSGLVCSGGACMIGTDAPIDAPPSFGDGGPTDAGVDAPIDDAPTDDAPADDAPIDDAPTDDAPTDDAPTEDAPA